MSSEKLTYEQASNELEGIVEQMQQQTISIDQLEAQSKRAAELLRFCKEKLRNIEQGLDETFELEGGK